MKKNCALPPARNTVELGLVNAGASFTTRLNDCVVGEPMPLETDTVIGYTPPASSVGVSVGVPVSAPALVSETPLGSEPDTSA